MSKRKFIIKIRMFHYSVYIYFGIYSKKIDT